MPDILRRLAQTALSDPQRSAVKCGGAVLTYGELDRKSTLLAKKINAALGQDRSPVMVFGHLQPDMVLCFLACLKSGRPYLPCDSATPPLHLQHMRRSSGSRLLLQVHPDSPPRLPDIEVWSGLTISDPLAEPAEKSPIPIRDEDTAYVIYTSGTTGLPKGVRISYGALLDFTQWALTLCQSGKETASKHFLGHAPYSFDLSVMGLYPALYSGSQYEAIPRAGEMAPLELQLALTQSGADILVSTPSFIRLCLADTGFSQQSLPSLEKFLFCGETLSPATAYELMQRFPHAGIINTYGPTESTVAVTQVEITSMMAEKAEPLPLGVPKPGCLIWIQDEHGERLPEGSVGEIVLGGSTIAQGYLGAEPQEDKRFFYASSEEGSVRAYKTGDIGRISGGLLYFHGRADRQVKLRGYRIELSALESALCSLPEVGGAYADIVPDTDILAAWVVPEANAARPRGQTLLEALKDLLPGYTLPRQIIVLDRFPLTANGKLDTAALFYPSEIAPEDADPLAQSVIAAVLQVSGQLAAPDWDVDLYACGILDSLGFIELLDALYDHCQVDIQPTQIRREDTSTPRRILELVRDLRDS